MSQRQILKSESNIVGSIIVPSYKEGANVEPLVTQIYSELDSRNHPQFNRQTIETIYVDDNSNDGTEEKIKQLSSNSSSQSYPVRIIVRRSERGLSSAVMKGFDEAKGQYLICMDADLQHPPGKVIDLFIALSQKDTEFVIGTRYGKGVAIDKDWPLHRRIISSGARLLALGLTPLTDPMSGFFAIRKDVYQKGKSKVNNVGFKIALELFVKCGIRKSDEVPFSFGVRLAGESKLTGKVIVKYLEQLWQLYNYKYPIVFPLLLLTLVVLALYVLYALLQFL